MVLLPIELGISVRAHHELLQYIFRCGEMQGFYKHRMFSEI